MRKFSEIQILLAVLLVLAPLGALADTFFTDNFSNGSTTNGLSIPGGPPTTSHTSYDFASSKDSTASTIGPGLLSGKLTGNTTSGYWEAQALFSTTPIALVSAGDYLDLTIVFTNSAGTIMTGSASPIWMGLYNSGAPAGTTNPPVAGELANHGLNTTSGSPYATGNCQLWQGYVGQLYSGGGSRIITRPVQETSYGTTSANQELLGNGVSGGTFGKTSDGSGPPGATLVQSATQTATLDTSSAYTVQLEISLNPTNSDELIISNTLYSGAGTGGTALITNSVNTSTVITKAFDGFAFGLFNHNGSYNPQMDVSSISITGHTTAITNAPAITNQPVSVSAALGSTVPFTVGASGFNMTYQWHRNGTNLVDGGNISGATSPTLIISPVTAADVSSSYYVTVTGAGDYSTNSTMVSLSLRTANNLVWSGSGNSWDLNNTADWLNGTSSSTFNYGDAVTFDDTGVSGNPTVYFNNAFLSASSVTVNTSGLGYTFTGNGSFAGTGSLNYTGSGGLEIDNANTYTGGTIISNTSTFGLYLNNLNGLGTGPITLYTGFMEVVPTGGSSYGIPGDIIVSNDFTIQFDGYGAYAGVFFGNLSGGAGKTLTLQPGNLTVTTTNRYRVYGTNTVYDGNLVLDGPAVANGNYQGTALAPYNDSGTQTYNGVISGNGGLVERGGHGITILNGPNTYAGGTTPTTGTIAIGANSSGNPVTSGPLGTGPLYLAAEVPHTSGSATILSYGGAHTIANPLEYPSGTNDLTLTVGGTNALTFAGPFTLNGNDGTVTETNRTLNVTDTALTTISGQISDGGAGFNFIKTGSGTLALTAAENYSGTTTVGGGTLLVNGSLGAGGVMVTNGLLGGTGTIAGTVTATSGGVAPGNNGSGTLTINNSLTLESGSSNVFEVNKTAGTYGQLHVSGALTYGGTLYAANLSGTLTTSDSFTIVSAGSETGSFATIAGSPGPGLAWSFDPTNGVLSVVTGVATNPTNIIVSVTGGNPPTVNMSWPADHLGWTLQTNSVGLTATNMWFAYPGSTSVTNVSIPMDQTKTNVFYRLTYTP